ncbi:MAG: restriction endonuclease [Myxococcales bacterium]|nr:restriction endonuclease [Myxococcales bacterium]
MSSQNSVFGDLRREFHRGLCAEILGRRPGSPVFSIADKDSPFSVAIAEAMVMRMNAPICDEPQMGQTAGKLFAEHTLAFLKSCFDRLGHLRPGTWKFDTKGYGKGISEFDQYEHLAAIAELAKANQEVRAALGSDYLIVPDIVVTRVPVSDEEINANERLVSSEDAVAAKLSPLRALNVPIARNILHASISCKWTMRSDRSQNSRTEALNLIRNRKGRAPHITVVTCEPLPSRLASIAMGTGDVDCTYHAALHELASSVADLRIADPRLADQKEMLDTLVEGRRLRDISDLPLDLAI